MKGTIIYRKSKAKKNHIDRALKMRMKNNKKNKGLISSFA